MLDSDSVKTEKIYYEDAYAVHFTANVISSGGNSIVLDRTAFFPEEGGQSPDRGVIAGFPVVDVRIRDGYTLLLSAADADPALTREATLEEIMIHLEKEGESC